MVSWWGRYSYFNQEEIQTRDVVLMDVAYGSSISFGSRIRPKCIGHNIYTGRRSNVCSKPTSIHGPVNKYDLNFSNSKSHFSCLPQLFSKGLVNRLSRKFSNSSMIIYTVVNGYSTNEVKSHLHIFDHSLITFGSKVSICDFQTLSC